MGQYYYFAATLPFIAFDSKPPISVDNFLIESQRLLDTQDCALLENLLTNDHGVISTSNFFYNSWKTFIHNLCNELVWFRAQRLNKDPLEYLQGVRMVDPFWLEIIQQASRISNLLEAERFLDKAKWQYLDELTIGHYFDSEFIFAYGLKIKILERYQLIYSIKGKEKLDEYKGIATAETQKSLSR